MNVTENDFRKVEWGKDDSKHDSGLLHYFVTIPEYDGLLDGTYRYIIGRKGTGKTAICRHIELTAESEPLWFNRYLSLRSFPLAELRKLEERSMAEKSKFVPIWKFLMLCEIIDMISEDEGAPYDERKIFLQEFLKRNFPEGVGFAETLSTLHAQERKVKVSNKWVGGAQASDSTEDSFQCSIQYQKATDILIRELCAMESESVYFLVIDELDEGWRAGDSKLRLVLLALLRAVEEVAQSFEGTGLKIRPILALRSDIFDGLEDGDINKYDDYLIRLRWSSQENSHYPLGDIVNARIAHSLELSRVQNLWECVADEKDSEMQTKDPSLWKWITKRTLERPRDVIKYLKLCKKIAPAGRLKFKQVLLAEKPYSDWFYKEIRDEIQSHMTIWREALDAISRVGVVKIEKPVKLLNELSSDSVVAAWLLERKKGPEFILTELFEFGILGNIKANGYWQFKYKNEDAMLDVRKPIVIHYGLIRKLGLKNNFV